MSIIFFLSLCILSIILSSLVAPPVPPPPVLPLPPSRRACSRRAPRPPPAPMEGQLNRQLSLWKGLLPSNQIQGPPSECSTQRVLVSGNYARAGLRAQKATGATDIRLCAPTFSLGAQ